MAAMAAAVTAAVTAKAVTVGNEAVLSDDFSALLKTPASDSFHLNEWEKQALSLWDQEQESQLELGLLEAQSELEHDDGLQTVSDQELQSQIEIAERDLLTARSKYSIRRNITQQLLITDPILKAVHSGSSVTALEQRLLPLVHERDGLEMLEAVLSSRLQTLHKDLARLEQENLALNEGNRQMAQKVMGLAKGAKSDRIEDVRDAKLRMQLEKVEGELDAARRDWRMTKSVAAAIVAGSGVNWADNDRLLRVVLDEEDELG